MKNKIVNSVKENIAIVVILLAMAIVYGIMMFTNGPWYDELYTYYSFISRGPVYAAIHWPVPNNHVGYSVLSAFLDMFGNAYIGLRGVSYIASLLNIWLIYKLAGKFLDKEWSALASVIYIGAILVNSLSIQGRGYSLAITAFLVAALNCYAVCTEDAKLINYICFAIALTAGLYVLPSSTYWVMPICFIGGIYLLVNKDITKLIRLIISAVVAAVMTAGLYAIIWLAIGSNLMSKNPENPYFGVYQVNIILKAPFAALKTGIDYMLASPYIQSIDRSEAVLGLPQYFRELFDQCYLRGGIVLSIILIILAVTGIYLYVREKNWMSLFVGGMLTIVPVMLIIQSVHPYKRVLSFIMVPMAIGIAWMLKCAISRVKYGCILCYGLIFFIAIIMATGYDYRSPLADRENDIKEALNVMEEAGISPAGIDSIYYTDDFQKYVLKFYYDNEPAELTLEEANYVMVSPEMRDSDYDAFIWPMLTVHDPDMLEYIEANFTSVYDGGEYAVYARK